MALKILIIGAGVCGPALALLLRRASAASHEITVVERAPCLRQTGLQIDLRAQGIAVVRKLGLTDAVREAVVSEAGFTIVDADGKQRAVFGKNESGRGQQSFTSEFEIMRGDLVGVFYRASLEERKEETTQSGGSTVHYEFDRSVTDLTQDDTGATATFSDGTTRSYDLVVGADGQRSRTRRMVLGSQAASDATFRSLRLFIAYFTIPRAADDNDLAKWFSAPGSRGIMVRSGANQPRTQIYLAKHVDSEHGPEAAELRACLKEPAAAQMDAFARLFDGAGWQTERFLREMRADPDFYAQEIGQVKGCQLTRGRVALVGDAGYTPSPITGMGTTLALTGAYVLAGELARHGGDVEAALKGYERVMRPFVDEAQKLPPGAPGILYMKSKWGVGVFNSIATWVSWLGIDKLVNQMMPEDKGGLKIPEYPKLDLLP
ncbi:Uu.00g131530.m01.CDS01 [Anthostomella pinea]|uniref:Uu.00g131530.m01.CDS01 n=1 Tax=Anthostomella pinea TaxID=933095 RepID=A0AAI8YI96_9PEZI|nr:Uu.00g131530.m01.CDS01 [Anthostomella pinea]